MLLFQMEGAPLTRCHFSSQMQRKQKVAVMIESNLVAKSKWGGGCDGASGKHGKRERERERERERKRKFGKRPSDLKVSGYGQTAN